ncbi:MAG: class II aldolase/adducin family protein [Chromatiales bacterium]|nr:class II aldolase/adducin family protein [Chromatiales bacterium]
MSAVAESVRPFCSDAEWQTRVDLAALYRLYVRYGWTDLIYTHISARVPDEPGNYLINPYGPFFDEMTASMMIKVDLDGNLLDERGYEYNEAGHLIHSAVLKARPDMNFVLHTHSRSGTAVSAMTCGFLPLSQHSNIILDAIGYHDYAQVTEDEDECERLGADLGDRNLLVLRNHGLLSAGRTAAEAFWYLYYLEMACKIQVDVLTAGTEYIVPDDDAISGLKAYGKPGSDAKGAREWPGLLRMLDRADPSYRD